MAYWLLKTEPTTFSIDDLAKKSNQTEPWEGVRNYQARNFIRDEMQMGDQAFFYHSNCASLGIVGIVQIVSEAEPDATAFDPKSPYYDSRSQHNSPRWWLRHVKLERKFSRIITLAELKAHPALQQMKAIQRGNRLSITPVTQKEWEAVQKYR